MTLFQQTPAVIKKRRGSSRCTKMLDSESAALEALRIIHGLDNVARAADCSVQSLVKAIAGMPLYESTKRRLRTVLRQP